MTDLYLCRVSPLGWTMAGDRWVTGSRSHLYAYIVVNVAHLSRDSVDNACIFRITAGSTPKDGRRRFYEGGIVKIVRMWSVIYLDLGSCLTQGSSRRGQRVRLGLRRQAARVVITCGTTFVTKLVFPEPHFERLLRDVSGTMESGKCLWKG